VATAIFPAPRRRFYAGKTCVARHGVSAALLALTLGFIPAALAQTADELRFLIFEPVLLSGVEPAAGNSVTGAGTTPGEAAPPQEELGNDIARYQERIKSLALTENPYSPSLREQYSALGLLLQRTGDHSGAILALESAMHIDRVNEGLFTVNQIPLVESIIASHEALGNFREVDDYHEYLYYIQLKSWPADDPRLLAAKEAWADWNLTSYYRQGSTINQNYVAIQHPVNGSYNYVPRNQLPNLLTPGPMAANSRFGDLYTNSTQFAVNAEQLIDPRLRKARDLYEEIRETRATSGNSNGAFSAEHKLAAITFAIKNSFEHLEAVGTGTFGSSRMLTSRSTPMVVTRGYSDSQDNLEAVAQQLEQNPDSSPAETAQAWILLGDWHISFGRTQRAETAYARAWSVLQDAGVDAAASAAVFAPAPLMPVPVFALHPYSRALNGHAFDEGSPYRGYADVTLDIDRSGNVRNARIDATSPDTSQTLRSTLLDFLRETRVRPAVSAGELVARDGVQLRFYYIY